MGQNDMVDKFPNLFGQPVVFNWQVFSLPRTPQSPFIQNRDMGVCQNIYF
jgi:hypothetical protein